MDPGNIKVWQGRRTCLTCKREQAAADRRDPEKRERILGYWRAYKKRKRLDPEWNARRRESVEAGRIKWLYGLDRAAYQALLDAQGGVCAVCKGPSRYKRRDGSLSGRFAVDHDHSCCPGIKTCGKCIRGLLCDQCNRLIGHLETDRARAAAIIRYIGLSD